MLRRMMTYEVRREDVPKVLDAARAFVDEVARKEGGTASYRVYHHKEPLGRFTHVMEFRAPAGQKYHEGTAWAKRFHATLLPLCTTPPAFSDVELVE